MVAGGSWLYLVILCGYWWFLMVLNSSFTVFWLFFLVVGGCQWFLLVLVCFFAFVFFWPGHAGF